MTHASKTKAPTPDKPTGQSGRNGFSAQSKGVEMTEINYEWLGEHEACDEAIQWLHSHPTIASAWQACERGDWMLWLLDKAGLDDRTQLKLSLAMLQTPLADGRVVEDLLTDERSKAFVALKRRKLAGDAIDRAAWAAARAVAEDAAEDAAWAAAEDAAWAAAGAAAEAAARAAAEDAAWVAARAAARAVAEDAAEDAAEAAARAAAEDAAWAAAGAAAWAAARAAAEDAARAWQAQAVREIIPDIVPLIGALA